MKQAFYTLLILVLISSPVHGRGTDGVLTDHFGKIITALEITGAKVSSWEMKALVPVEVGDVLSPEKVREGVLNLHRTGLYERVEVRVRALTDGVALRYEVVPRRWLEEVEFEGNLALSDSELLRKVSFRRNEEVTAERLAENALRLKDYYTFRGYPGTEVRHRIETLEDNRTRVIFELNEGLGLTISRIDLNGNPGFSRIKLLSIIASAPGGRYDGERVEKDVRKLKDRFRESFHLNPDISYTTEPADDFHGSIVLTFMVNQGPLTVLSTEIEDPEEMKRVLRRMKKVFLASDTVEKAKSVLAEELTLRYRSQGYPFFNHTWQEDSSDPSIHKISLSLDPGLRTYIGGVEVNGVEFLSDDRLNAVLGMEIGSPFVKSRLDEGVQYLLREYRHEGFVDVETEVKPLNFTAFIGHQEVKVVIVLQEGERTILKQLDVNGGPYSKEVVMELMDVQEGEGYVPEFIQKGRESVLQSLGTGGYLYAAVSVQEPRTVGEGEVEITLEIKEGPKVRLGSVIITGNENVSPRIIRLALDLKRGKVITRDEILKAQKRIYELGVMSSVDVQLADPDVPQEQKDLMVRVKERPRYVVGFRLGYGSEDKLRGSASITNRNVGSMARKVTVRGKASEIERSTTVLYNHPWYFSKPVDLTLSLVDLLEERESYTRDSLSVAADFVRAMSERTETRLGYSFEGLRLRDVSPDAQLSADDVGETDIAAVVGEIVFDSRDDFLDPWSGLLGDLLLEIASAGLGSEAEYSKMELALHRYIHIGGGTVLAGLLRTGGVVAHGKSEDVIISKRFFLGGQNSVRGYALDSLGPRDESGDPVGGNYMLNANLEFRFGLYKTIRGVLFLDSGSVWLHQNSTVGEADFALRASGGAGLRWSSPIGPLSLDYGYKLNPVDEDLNDRYRWHFSIGHAF
jgi:outer membrane protein assembly complex protein YaeT